MAIPTELFILGAGYVLLFAGLAIERARMMKFMAAMLIFAMGIYTLFPGYGGINHSNLVGLSLGTISIGLGFWFLVEDAMSHDRQVESFDQFDDGRFHE